MIVESQRIVNLEARGDIGCSENDLNLPADLINDQVVLSSFRQHKHQDETVNEDTTFLEMRVSSKGPTT